MIALEIQSLGSFMSGLFSHNTFDSFLLTEGALQMGISWHVDGKLNRDFFEKEMWEDPAQRPYDYVTWSEARPALRELIRGKKAPVSFQFVLQLKPEYVKAILEKEGEPALMNSVGAFVLTIRYRNGAANILTGIFLKSFTLNKNADILWDKTVRRFLQAKEISFEETG
ncbi:MAG: DUF5721 family protein [Eubacteriales bacterium]|nr:hypothetical protein [Lachnospiraceae bacterium]MDO4417889.1 DUF5721 family protein [Eubacteriales bacterium]